MTALPPEQELHLLRQQQEALLRAIAHDLPAPLRHIQSFAPLLVEAVQTLAAAAPHAAEAAADALECAQFMQQGAQRMGQMLQALAELSRAARMPLHLQAVEVVATCQALLPALQQQYPQAQFSLPAAPVWVQADAQALTQVLQQLLANACKFAAPTPQVQLQAVADGAVWQCAVRDNGVGFESEQAAQLFQPFARLHRESQFAGLGCGLALVQTLAVRHGAQARIAAQPGQGCTVQLAWPAAHPAAHQPNQTGPV